MHKRLSLVKGCLALSALLADPAMADLFEFQWGYRWSAGTIAHTTDVVDSDPSSFRDVYRDSIRDYHFDAWSFEEAGLVRFSGHGGTLVVDHGRQAAGRDGCPTDAAGCLIDGFTFFLGTPEAPLIVSAGAVLIPFDAPGPRLRASLDTVWSANLSGSIRSGRIDGPLDAMSEMVTSWHVRLASPVPEPGSLVLMVAGLAVVSRRAAVAARCNHRCGDGAASDGRRGESVNEIDAYHSRSSRSHIGSGP